MPVDNTAFTQEEIDFLAQATLSRRIAKKGEVQPLDRIESGTFKFAMQRAKNFGPPVQGGFRFYVKGNRGQKVQWWQGADILTFENKSTLSDMVFSVGKGHMGYELLYDTIERNGIRVNYNRGIREGQSDKAVVERVVNIIEQTMDDVEYNYLSEMRKHFFKSNIDQPKCFTGLDGLFPATTNNTGTIGQRPRSNRLFQHQLYTGVTKDNLMLAFFKLVRAANRRAGGTKIDYIACGDNFYNTLVDLFAGASTTAGKFDYRSARDMAMKKGEKYNVSLPQDCFAYEDTLIVNDPVFEELDLENPTLSPTWANQARFFNFSHFGIIPVIDEMQVPHAMPYNQRLERVSLHCEFVEWSDLPSSQGVMVLA
jgi:hypothetical protein